MSRQAVGKADLIVHARRIHTMDRARPSVAAVAVAGGRIVAVGSRRQMRQWKGRTTSVLGAPDAVGVPAFADCHTHLFNWACRLNLLDLAGVASLALVLRRIERRSEQTTGGEWLLAGGFDLSLLDEGGAVPTPRRLLDQAVGDRPAMVKSRDGHSAWLSSAGLRAAGITARTRTPPGGRIERDHRGRPTGIVQENALSLVPNPSDMLSDGQVRSGMGGAIRRAHRFGVTTVHSLEDRRAFEWFTRLRQGGRLDLRVCWAPPAGLLDHARQIGLKSGFGDDFLWIGGIKLFADGALGSQTAYMYGSYPGRRGYCGVATCVGKRLRDQVEQAARAGLASWIHAIGDRANHEALVALAAARRVEPTRLIHRVEHAQCVRPADVRRFARLGVVASMQPCHLPGDIALADRYWPKAGQRAYPFRSLLAAGAPVAFGSDVPVETMDPIFGIHAAVNRQDRNDQPVGGSYPTERITVSQALAAYTVGAARAGGRGGCMGRLSPGMAADIVLLSEDVLRVPARRIRDVRVVATVFDGRVVYRR